MALYQLIYTYSDKAYHRDLNHLTLAKQSLDLCVFTTNTSFNLAHWFFAFSYWALSHRFELIAKGLPEDTHRCRLKTVNAIVCLLNFAITVAEWVVA